MAVDFKKILTVAKKNGVSIGAGLVALVSIGVPFFYADGIVSSVEASLSSSKGTADNVNSVSNKPRKLPILIPEGTEGAPLETFPNETVIKKASTAVDQFKSQAAALLDEAVAMNRRTPLVPGVFLDPNRYGQYAYQFRDQYKFINESLTKLINGGVPYLPEQINQAVTNEKERINQTMALRQGGTVINQAEVTAALLKVDTTIPLAMRGEIANTHPIYVSRDAWTIASPQAIAVTGPAPRPEAVWMAQLSIWIQEDVANIINNANKGSKSVLTSAVKHLLKVNVPLSAMTGPYVLVKAGGEGAAGISVTKVNPGATLTPDRAFTITGRTGNGLYDVVNYQMVVRVSESKIAQFLAEIPKNRLHYVLRVDARSVDSATEASIGGFIYGTEPVVELIIDCEALYLRKWTEPLMPLGIKQLVGIVDPPAGGLQGGGFGGSGGGGGFGADRPGGGAGGF